jgi:hypothetical protein
VELLAKKVINIHIHKIYDLKDAGLAQAELEGE